MDGDDYWIFLALTRRPHLLTIEYNRTVPPHIDLIPSGPGNAFGIGALSLVRAAEEKDYRLIGLTDGNLFFVCSEDAEQFADLETDLSALMPAEQFTYLATDFLGRIVPIGGVAPWGLVWPVSDTAFTNQDHLLSIEATKTRDRLLQQVEKLELLVVQPIVELRTAVNRYVDEGDEW